MDLKEVFRFVSPEVKDAAIEASSKLDQLGIRHAIAGGLAVGAHGYVRATIDVDFLVGEEAFEHQGSLVTFKAGVPIEVNAVRIDYLSPTALGAQVEDVLNDPPRSQGLPVLPIEVLIFTKLTSKRRRDIVDVIELVRAGANATLVREYLKHHADDLLPVFEELIEEALGG